MPKRIILNKTELSDLLLSGHTQKDIAVLLGLNHKTISKNVKEYGLSKLSNYYKIDKQSVINMFDSGKTTKDISIHLGVTPSSVRKYIKKNNLEAYREKAKVLRECFIEDIMRLAIQGWYLVKIARYLDMSPATVIRYCKKANVKIQKKKHWSNNAYKSRGLIRKKSQPCACGCDKDTELGNKFIHGHNIYTVEHMLKRSAGTSKYFKERYVKKIELVYCSSCGEKLERNPSQLTRGGAPLKDFFCNRKCHGKWRSNLRGEDTGNWKGGKIELICSECDTFFQRYQSDVKDGTENNFCTHTCHNEWRSKHYFGEMCSNWRGGISYQEYCSAWKDKEYKSDLRKRDYEICALCESEKSLCLHHVDYDKQNCKPNNLITLCNRCNSKVNFSRSFWQAYFEYIMSLGKVQRLSFLGVGPSGPKRRATQQGLMI